MSNQILRDECGLEAIGQVIVSIVSFDAVGIETGTSFAKNYCKPCRQAHTETLFAGCYAQQETQIIY